MALAAGTRLGPYEVLSLIGAGGMGEVYRARDTRLGRDVAMKVLPPAFASDVERLARFEREARVLAALNHPNIATIYGIEDADGVVAIVMELIEGKSLAATLKSGRPLPLDQALAVVLQIAEGLDAAHERGIVHRDLKPANIVMSRDGRVKILDFGLARISVDEDGTADSRSPTITLQRTREGDVMGTPAYMSPEQARGEPIDKRTDIWAFGCVLFEMLTGKRAFPGSAYSETVASVIAREPDWNALPAATPAAVKQMLQRCLIKDVKQRLRDIGEVPHEVRGAPYSKTRRLPWRGIAVAAGVVLIVALGGAAMWNRPAPVESKVSDAPVNEPPLQLTDFSDSALYPALAPDGRMLAFIRGGSFGDSAVRGQVYVKILPSGEPVALTRDPYNKETPTFSPDGSRIVYTSIQPGFRWDSWHVPVLGGSPEAFLPNASGLVWLNDRRMMYAEIMGGGVHMGIAESAENGSDHRGIYMPPTEGGMAHRAARSPDGRSLLVVEMDGGGWLPCRLLPFDGSTTGRAVGPPEAQCTTAAWSPDGHWMYFSTNAGGGFHVWRQRYPDGTPEQVTPGPFEQEGTTLTADGKYLITSMGVQHGTVFLHDGKGERPLTSEAYAMLPTRSPRGDRVFYLVRTARALSYLSAELWSIDIASGQRRRELPGRVIAGYSLSHDGKRVVFTSVDHPGAEGIWVADLDHAAPPRQLTRGNEFRAFYGRPGQIIYMSKEPRHLYSMNEDGGDVRRILETPVTTLISASRDGNWAVALMPRASDAGGTRLGFISTHGQEMFVACKDGCSIGFGPGRMQSPPITWTNDGKSLIVSLQYWGLRTRRSVVLPYRTGVPLAQQYPKGLDQQTEIPKNPGARVIEEADIFDPTPAGHLLWRRTTQSNLYRVAIPAPAR